MGVWVDAPTAPALEGDYAQNNDLNTLEVLFKDKCHACEDIAIDTLGRIYGGSVEGEIIRFDDLQSEGEVIATTGGRPLGLQVPSGKTLALIGGDISLQGGNLTAEGGRIELGSVLESALVELIPTSDGFTTGYNGVSKFGDINLSQATSVEVSGEGAGNLQLQGRKISLLEDSIIIADTLGKGNGGLFSVKASESLEIIGGGIPNIFTGFITGVEVGGTGNAGNTIIDTPQLSLMMPGSLISSATIGSGNAGNIILKVNNLAIRNRSYIQTATYASGNAGDLNLSAAKSVEVGGFRDNDFSYLSSAAIPGSSGNAGDLNIITPQLSLRQGYIIADTFGSGNAGNITLKVDSLNMRRDGSQIGTGTFADGNGGNLTITAADSVEITGGENNRFSTGLFTSAEFGSRGDAGNLSITTPKLSLLQGAKIESLTIGSGNAGKINLKVDNLTIRGGSRIRTETLADGNGGDLTVIAADSVEIDGFKTSSLGNIRSGLFSAADIDSSGDAGDLKIDSNQINIRDQAFISVSNLGSGNTGNLNLNADNIFLDNQASLEAQTTAGEQGNINLNSNFIQLRRNSNITTNATVTANGGNITINSPLIAGFENSDIIANAVEGNGGNINITTQGIFGLKFRDQITPESDIAASSQFGVNGVVDINNLGNDPSSGLVELNLELVDSSQQISRVCSTNNTMDNNFVITGRGGLPQNPREIFRSDQIQLDWATLKLEANSKNHSVTVKPSLRKPNKIVEATRWIINQKGEVILTANPVTSNSKTSWKLPNTCNKPKLGSHR